MAQSRAVLWCCNRRGEFTKDQPAQIYWIYVPAEDDNEAAPYTKDELDAARKQLKKLDDAGPEVTARVQ